MQLRLSNLKLNIFWLILTTPLFWLGLGRRFPFSAWGEPGVTFGKCLWFGVTVLWLIGFDWANRNPKQILQISKRAIPFFILSALVWTGLIDFFQWKSFEGIGYQKPLYLFLLEGLFFIFWWVWFRSKARSWQTAFVFSVVFSVVHLGLSIFYFPLKSERSDMIPMMQRALENWIHHQKAYDSQLTSAYRIPYPPLLWLSYWPAEVFKLDLRWMNVLFRSLLGIFLFRQFRQNHFALSYFSLWFISPYLSFRHELYYDFYWLILILALIFGLRKKLFLSTVFSGLLAMTLQWGWIQLPFLWMVSARSRKMSQLFLSISGTALLAGCCFYYFYQNEGDVFIQGLFQHFKLIGTSYFYTELCLGLATPFVYLGQVQFLIWLQRLVLFLFGFLALRTWLFQEKQHEKQILSLYVFAYFLFILLNPLIEAYFFLTPLLLAGFLEEKS